MQPISLVLFDMDNVLCRYDRAARIAYLSRLSGMSARGIEAAIWESGFETPADAGAIGAEEYLRGFGERIGYALTLDLARAVATSARVAVLTNNNTVFRDRIGDLLPELRPLFGEAVFASAEFRAAKPDPEVYRRCLAKLGAAPAEALFVDDSPENVAGAEEAGLSAHLYTPSGPSPPL